MDTQVAMTRARLYVLIDAFENDMRLIMNRYVLDHMDESEALGASYHRANQRRASDPVSDDSLITEYLDIQECYDILNRHRDCLPGELGRELKENTSLFVSLVPIRNRVMHGRPLVAGDPETTLLVCRTFATRYWTSVAEVIRHLESEPTWQPIEKDQDRSADRVLHNLPLPEYDETGLIGRSDLCRDIMRHLLRRREPILTLVGEGGIGKTALAVDVAYRLLDDLNSPYECILWASLKTERLTASGVVNIADAARDLTGAANRIGKALDESFAGGVSELSEAIDSIPTLLIIDNLETVTGDEVSALYDNLPDSVTFLLTSRVGIGQLERRINVGPLVDKDAAFLFRNFAKARGVSRLAKLSENTVSEVVKRLRNSPLAIRWYIMAVEAGQQPNLALADQTALLDFCVRTVYERMSSGAQLLLAVLFALDRSVSFDELALHTEMPVDQLRRSVQQLLNGSMVTLVNDNADTLSSKVALTESARNFLRAARPPRADQVEATLRRERDFRRSEERRRADAKSRQLAPNVVRIRTSADSPTAHLLRKALSMSRRESFSAAIDYIERARALNPDFWEVDRVEAFLLSAQGYVQQATTVYRNALRKVRETGDAEGIAVVSYYFAGHLARHANEPEQAVEYSRAAHVYFESPETAQELGKILTWIGSFEEAQHYLEECLDSATGKIRLIAMTTVVDSWKRWAEQLLVELRRPSEAADKAYAGFSSGAAEISSGTYDERLTDRVLDCAALFLRCASSTGFDSPGLSAQVERMLSAIDDRRNVFRSSRYYHSFIRNLNSLAKLRQLPSRVRLFQQADVVDQANAVRVGTVVGWRVTYGFIGHRDYPENIFFHESAISNPYEHGGDIDLHGLTVKFTVDPKGERRPRANWVEVEW